MPQGDDAPIRSSAYIGAAIDRSLCACAGGRGDHHQVQAWIVKRMQQVNHNDVVEDGLQRAALCHALPCGMIGTARAARRQSLKHLSSKGAPLQCAARVAAEVRTAQHNIAQCVTDAIMLRWKLRSTSQERWMWLGSSCAR